MLRPFSFKALSYTYTGKHSFYLALCKNALNFVVLYHYVMSQFTSIGGLDKYQTRKGTVENRGLLCVQSFEAKSGVRFVDI